MGRSAAARPGVPARSGLEPARFRIRPLPAGQMGPSLQVNRTHARSRRGRRDLQPKAAAGQVPGGDPRPDGAGRAHLRDRHASTDGTAEMLDEAGFLEDGRIELCRLPTNTGSAGGFHAGMRRAYEAGHAWLWLMDDDGYPAPDCLERLLAGRRKLDVVGPAVVLKEVTLR